MITELVFLPPTGRPDSARQQRDHGTPGRYDVKTTPVSSRSVFPYRDGKVEQAFVAVKCRLVQTVTAAGQVRNAGESCRAQAGSGRHTMSDYLHSQRLGSCSSWCADIQRYKHAENSTKAIATNCRDSAGLRVGCRQSVSVACHLGNPTTTTSKVRDKRGPAERRERSHDSR